GEKTLIAAVDASQPDMELDRTDNTLEKTVRLLPAPNLLIDRGNARASHEYVRPGDIVRVVVPIENPSDQDFTRELRFAAYAVRSNGVRRNIFMKQMDQMLAGESATLEFDWVVEPEENRLFLDLNEDREYLESTFADNTMNMEFRYLLAPSWFAEPARVWD